MSDISGYLAANAANSVGAAGQKTKAKKDDGMGLNMQDFLTLMVTELQSQSIDSTADTSEMLNQMVMMQMVSALTNMTDASVMGYAASLVGKTVTIGEVDAQGNVTEIVGTVTGTGMMDGKQVVFVNGKHYQMGEIMAVGTLPKGDGTPKPEKPSKPETPVQPETPPAPQQPQDAPKAYTGPWQAEPDTPYQTQNAVPQMPTI